MNKAEKKFAKQLLASYNSPTSNDSGFTPEENKILEHWEAQKLINEEAFLGSTSLLDTHKTYLRGRGYPFTALGDEEINKDWYLQFRNSRGVVIVRDVFTVTAFLLSLLLAISEVLSK